MVDRDCGVTSVTVNREALVSDESISMTDQEGESIAEHLASAERELSAFVTAVHQLFGDEQARQSADTWMEELERTDWPSESPLIDWREVTIAAEARLVGRDKHQLSETKRKVIQSDEEMLVQGSVSTESL
jgi:hypothetical protein